VALGLLGPPVTVPRLAYGAPTESTVASVRAPPECWPVSRTVRILICAVPTAAAGRPRGERREQRPPTYQNPEQCVRCERCPPASFFYTVYRFSQIGHFLPGATFDFPPFTSYTVLVLERLRVVNLLVSRVRWFGDVYGRSGESAVAPLRRRRSWTSLTSSGEKRLRLSRVCLDGRRRDRRVRGCPRVRGHRPRGRGRRSRVSTDHRSEAACSRRPRS